QVLFRRSAIDQLAGDGDMGSEINLDGLDLSSGGGSSLQLGGSSVGGMDELRLEDSSPGTAPAMGGGLGDDLRLEDSAPGTAPKMGGGLGDDLNLDDELRLDDGPAPMAGMAPMAASGADDSMGLDDLMLADDDAPAPAPAAPAPAPAARAAAPTRSPAASSGGSAMGGLGLADSNAESMMMDAPSALAKGGGMDDSMALNPGQTQLEAVGSGSGLLDISSDESFFGAQMIEESMGGDDAASIPENAADIFGGGEAAATEEAAPVTAGTTGVTFGTATLAEAHDPKFSGFAGGAMIVAALALGGAGWAVAEMAVGNYTDIAKLVAENWMYVLGGLAGGVLVFGGIGFGIGKATA
ncbi:MAG: hypothetical protein EBU31_13105, partial [Proteobacteria bacterium]|nr:hypothetical protein [Pseudomonadota bacterium]